nr:hypothetical protein [Tanacetum cinerariifolium]
ESDSEEIENFLNDDSIPIGVEDSPFNMEEDILFLEGLLIEDPSPPHPIILSQSKSPIEEPKHSFRMRYEHFSTNLVTNDVAESSTKNLVPIPRECEVTSDNGNESTEPVKDDSSVFTTISNPLFDNDKINYDEINSHVESNSVESTSNHDTVKFNNLDEFSGPLIPIYIVEEERIRREHAEYFNRMEMIMILNGKRSISLPVQMMCYLQDSDFDNPLVPLLPPKPPDEKFDFGDKISVVRNTIVKFECIDARVKFDVLSYFMFAKVFSFLSAESEDTIFDPDLKELAEYDQSTSMDRPIFHNNNEDHPVQNKESPENSSKETVKQKMENTMFELVKTCQEKEFLCIHDDVDNLIESALDSKLLLINSNCQRLDKKEQEVKNVVEQPAEHGNRSTQSLQNFRVVHKSSISFKNTSQISSIHSIAPIQSTKEPEHLLGMGYEHPSITPETKSDEVTESNAENLLPIPSKCEVTLEDEIECDMPANDDCSPVFPTFSNPLFKDNDDLDFSDDESLPDEDVLAEEFKIYSNPLFDEDETNSNKLDPHCFNVESNFVESLLNRDTFIDFSSKFDFSGELAHIKPEIPKFDFDFEEEIHLIENLLYDNSFPRPSKELRDIRFLKELLINDSILSHESFDSSFEDSPLIPRPPPEPPDVETNAGEEIPVVMNDKDEDVEYSPFIFVIYPEMFSFLLSAESEDTIFDPGISD